MLTIYLIFKTWIWMRVCVCVWMFQSSTLNSPIVLCTFKYCHRERIVIGDAGLCERQSSRKGVWNLWVIATVCISTCWSQKEREAEFSLTYGGNAPASNYYSREETCGVEPSSSGLTLSLSLSLSTAPGTLINAQKPEELSGSIWTLYTAN